ncbi:putative nicotinate-nucleotide adenylyltransferase [Alcaligenes pakistanensis]|uniref:Probable nicotinate-nucleotide adenylyltransferase n=1 Tax=Alcaligenes pakistanensis TaxID=1482717 RepID=A0A8H9M7G4_9BURK|nr:nicotinate (nicotinamide) nucleotide adenylyltransferase [Alcaligenes pakistanensis]MBP6623104.1 nicotinate (nicotinamide) nucleotide adenylyltransferase [Alcaligenes sp.]GHC39070.1 putative nicotinate-nucleotide adenylyltransferase [Alcaligenes pakistanensis]HCA18575.1 nicotinate (nicotinamide) nucleotide adenylyltransferase [Alcaligenes faecalis]
MDLKRVGLLGGSFDPIHKAHVALAVAAFEQLKLDQVQLLPAAQPWQRNTLGASTLDRLAMAELAAQSHPAMQVNPVEILRGGPTYTIDTVRELPAGSQYYWILGSDQLHNFCSWNDWQEILEYVELAVAQRPGNPLETPAALQQKLNQLQRRLHQIDFVPMDISATEIRERVQRGDNITPLVPEKVAQYIDKKRLYLSHPQVRPV